MRWGSSFVRLPGRRSNEAKQNGVQLLLGGPAVPAGLQLDFQQKPLNPADAPLDGGNSALDGGYTSGKLFHSAHSVLQGTEALVEMANVW